MAAFISNVCFSAQQWSDEFYHGQAKASKLITSRAVFGR